MPLRLESIAETIEQMVKLTPTDDRSPAVLKAQQLLRDVDPEKLIAKLQDRQTRVPWLVAVPIDTTDAVFAAPECPRDFTVVAADGSYIAPDRHGPLRFYVINTGYASLTYGASPSATLDCHANLCFRDEELYLDPPTGSFLIEGARLSVKMAIAEVQALWQAAREADHHVVALRDGSLILWGLQNEDARVQKELLGEFLECLDGFRKGGIPVVSYISHPGGGDVINSLRVWLCHQEAMDCSNCSASETTNPCRELVAILDRQLFGFLRAGERSDIFESTSAILNKYGAHHIRFFYLNVGGEVVRIEAPQWVTRDAGMLDLVHAVLCDQSHRSGIHPPYPPALQEAHEQAVISTTDRRLVERLVRRALARKGIVYTSSAKDRSKKRRPV